MKSRYEIEKEIENEFGKNFVEIMKYKKDIYDKLQQELKDVEDFERKVQEKRNEFSKDFVYISDNYNIYPDESCSQYLERFARECVENNYTKEEEIERFNDIQVECLNSIKDDCEELLNVINDKLKNENR